MDQSRSFGCLSRDFRLSVQNLEESVRGYSKTERFAVPLPEPIIMTTRPVVDIH